MSLEQTMTLPGAGALPSTGAGRFDTKTRRSEMTVSMNLSSLSDEGAPGHD
ncbi:MAG: hypothetical protein QOJ63_1859 [Solirubrobacteraceae bacterium]|jgi:hypothetical protein|nr:hypothetical protein [Solirubrobacteraceae bacterium]